MENVKVELNYGKFGLKVECSEGLAIMILQGIKNMQVEPEMANMIISGMHDLVEGWGRGLKND